MKKVPGYEETLDRKVEKWMDRDGASEPYAGSKITVVKAREENVKV